MRFEVGGDIFPRLLTMMVVPLVMASVMSGMIGLGGSQAGPAWGHCRRLLPDDHRPGGHRRPDHGDLIRPGIGAVDAAPLAAGHGGAFGRAGVLQRGRGGRVRAPAAGERRRQGQLRDARAELGEHVVGQRQACAGRHLPRLQGALRGPLPRPIRLLFQPAQQAARPGGSPMSLRVPFRCPTASELWLEGPDSLVSDRTQPGPDSGSGYRMG